MVAILRPEPFDRSSHVHSLLRSLGLFPRKGGGGHGGGGHGGGHGGKSSSSGGKSSSSGGKSSSSSGKSSSSGSKSSGSRIGSLSLGSSSGGRKASSLSSGGGKPFKLPSGNPFAGRRAGGGTRNDIYGTSRYGSGYTYGGGGYWVEERPFPYVFWPVPVHQHYYGCDEYHEHEDQRPGGNTTTATVTSNVTTTTQTYRLIGDKSSVTTVLEAIIAQCGASNSTSSITPFTGFDNESNSSLPKPEQFVQWYRASSFGLSLDGYNNTAALPSNMPPSNTTAPPNISVTPLPASVNTTFLACLNTTIAASLPLIDPAHKKHLSQAAIAGIVIGALLGLIFLTYVVVKIYGACRNFIAKRAAQKQYKAAELPAAAQMTRNGREHYASLDPPPPPMSFVDPYDPSERIPFPSPGHISEEPKYLKPY